MKIAIVRQRYSPHGGAEKFVSRALATLQSDDLKVQLLARKWEEVEGVEFISRNPFYLGRIWRDWSFASSVCSYLSNHDVDLVQSHERMSCCDIYRAGDGVHRVWLEQKARVLNLPKRLFQAISPYHLYVKQAEKKLFESNRLKAVICNSEMVKDEILDHFKIDKEKLHVIYSGVDLDRFHPENRKYRKQVLAKLRIPASATVFAFVGSGFERKGLKTVLEAFAQLDNTGYLIIAGYDKHQSVYEKLADQLGIKQRVRFLGSVKDVTNCYGAADAFVQPSLYDPFPNAVLEAMASGLPVITSFKTGAAEVIRQGENGFAFNALDVDNISQVMSQLQNQQFTQTVSKASRQTAEQFDTPKMVQKLTDLYQTLST